MDKEHLENYIQNMFKQYGNQKFGFSINISYLDLTKITLKTIIELCDRYIMSFEYSCYDQERLIFQYSALEKEHWYLKRIGGLK